MTNSDPIGMWLAASVATGVTAHILLAVRDRRTYGRLREAYVRAVGAAQETGAADALVHAQELGQRLMRVRHPRWFSGLGARLKAALVSGAVVGVALMVGTGRLPPVVAGIAVLFAIGLRRILLTTALLLAFFAASSFLRQARPADGTPASQFATSRIAAELPARSP